MWRDKGQQEATHGRSQSEERPARCHGPVCQPAIERPATDQGANDQDAGGINSSSVRIG
jgi:hypothetical protein